MLNSRNFRGLGFMSIMGLLAGLQGGIQGPRVSATPNTFRKNTDTSHNRQFKGKGIVMRTLWESDHQGTYVRAKHGELKSINAPMAR